MKPKKLILITVIAVLCTSIMAISFTFAWFKNYKTNRVLTNEVQVSSSSVLLISSTPDGEYGTTLSYSFDGLQLDDITGNGISFMAVPLENKANISEHNIDYLGLYSSVPDINGAWRAAVFTDGENNLDTAEYISLDLYFRASFKANIFLGANSYVSPASDTVIGGDSGNKSAYGDFSRDCIAGAVRVSVIDSASPDSCKVWIPNPSYELSFVKNTGWSMNLEGNQENKAGITDSGYYYFNTDKEKRYLNVDNASVFTSIPDTGIAATTLTESEDTPGQYNGHVTVNIWIEGCDREARRALAGGCLKVNLDFTAEEITEP